jgi:hypothetical protein
MTKPDSTSTKPSDTTPQSTSVAHTHKDGGPQDETTLPPPPSTPDEQSATPKL